MQQLQYSIFLYAIQYLYCIEIDRTSSLQVAAVDQDFLGDGLLRPQSSSATPRPSASSMHEILGGGPASAVADPESEFMANPLGRKAMISLEKQLKMEEPERKFDQRVRLIYPGFSLSPKNRL